MAGKETSADRAARSGFGRKLSAWMDDNRRRRVQGRSHGPTNPVELAARITHLGDEVNAESIRRWLDGRGMPTGRYIGHIERLMGAAWAYLDDPTTPWPRPLDEDAVMDLVRLLTPAQLSEWVNRMRSGLGQ